MLLWSWPHFVQLISVLPAPGSGKTFAVTGGAQRFSVRKPCGLESLNFCPPVPIVFPLDPRHGALWWRCFLQTASLDDSSILKYIEAYWDFEFELGCVCSKCQSCRQPLKRSHAAAITLPWRFGARTGTLVPVNFGHGAICSSNTGATGQ